MRLAEAERAAQAATRPPVPTETCAACAATAPAATHEITTRTGAPYRLGIRGPLCGACAEVAAVVLAEQTLSDGRSRRQAVAEAAGLDASGQSCAERDRARLLALTERG